MLDAFSGLTLAKSCDAIDSVSNYEQVIVMRKEPSAAEKMNGAVAPNLVDLTDRVRLREVWKRQHRSQRDRRLVDASPVWEGSHEGPGAPDVATLARLISIYAPHDGRFTLRIPGVHAIRASRPHAELVHTMWQPGLCIVAQGAKRVMLGQQVYEYDESRMLVAAVDVPVAAQVTRASRAEPYLCLRLDFDSGLPNWSGKSIRTACRGSKRYARCTWGRPTHRS